MVLCFLVLWFTAKFGYGHAWLETEQTIPDQVHKPTSATTTMRWVFECFEGIELLHVQTCSSFTHHRLTS